MLILFMILLTFRRFINFMFTSFISFIDINYIKSSAQLSSFMPKTKTNFLLISRRHVHGYLSLAFHARHGISFGNIYRKSILMIHGKNKYVYEENVKQSNGKERKIEMIAWPIWIENSSISLINRFITFSLDQRVEFMN